ncbi:MAG: hypothetical protein HFJ50_03745 [Clostridia bacterium]|nr:hypothetical protein [Clostridia bacterium]
MKTVYLNEKKKLTKRKINKIAKKLEKINEKEEIVLAISKKLSENEELVNEIKRRKIAILNRQMDL